MVKVILKNLLIGFLISAGLLFLLAFLTYRFELGEKIVNLVITGIYIISNFITGLLVGKKLQNRKFLWGTLTGLCYFVVLIVVSLMINGGVKEVAENFFLTLFLCAISGMVGGMIA